MSRLITQLCHRGRILGLLAIFSVLGACAAPAEDQPTANLTTTGPSRPPATVAPPTATVTGNFDQPTKEATEIALPSPTTAQETAQQTALQSELDLPPGTSIALHQTGGFAGVDNWWIFYDDGLIDTPSGEQLTVTAEEVADQLAELDATGFFDMQQPDSKPICCDHFTYTLYARDGDRENSITISDGDADLSPVLAAVIQDLQTLAANGENP